jgi:ArsR family transcriptional regulator
MDMKNAIRALSALAQERRLEVFRLLVREGPLGLPAGEIARRCDVPHNTMSSHLSILAAAGLVRARREGRSIFYATDYDGTQAMLAYLMEDCCRGRPDVCQPLIACVLPDAADPIRGDQRREATACEPVCA